MQIELHRASCSLALSLYIPSLYKLETELGRTYMDEPKKTPIQNPMTVLRVEFDDWAILFDPDRAKTMGINPTGVAVWKLIDGQNGLEDIVKGITEKFSDVSISLEKEISDFIDELYKNGFIGYSLNGET